MPSNETRRQLLAAVAACEDKKAEDTRILELDPSDSGFTDYFLITSGTNERQNQAIADDIQLRLKRDFGVYANSVEGHRKAEWILLDYVDFVVHIFSAEKRAFYDIERLRKTAKSVQPADLDGDLKKSLTAKTAAARKKAAAKKTQESPTLKKKTPAKKPVAKKTAAKKAVAIPRATTEKSAESNGSGQIKVRTQRLAPGRK